MDSELTELDDWVGTLEELQLGLERKCPSGSSNRLASSSYSGSHQLACSSPVPPAPLRVGQILNIPPALPSRRNSHLSPPPPPPLPPPPRVWASAEDPLCPREEGGVVSAPTTKTFTHSICACFNPLNCREATAENDLDCLLRQLEEMENTMKLLEQDDGDFARRYSLASSSTTDPNTGCNSSPVPDAPEQVASLTLSPLVTNGNGHGSFYEQQKIEMRPALPPRSFPMRPPSLPGTDYELADEVSTSVLLAPSASITARFTQVVPHDGGLSGDRSQDRGEFERNGMTQLYPIEASEPLIQIPRSRLSSFDSSSSGRSSSAALRSPPPPPLDTRLGTIPSNSSFSGKSMPDIRELSKKLSQAVDLANRLQLNKLVVRIFRPDRTTKAILIDQRMTAGEVASIMVEKNFLEPSIKLCLVEKVPSLKVERIFEESETVAECILAWPVKSQNMIFFESRDDHFGFIESPKDWLGEAYANGHDIHLNDPAMLENFTSSKLTEWHDFLYIRKPGEKAWTRRLCVLRNSGLYATKKNKKSLMANDLVRLLGVERLHIYTTTGGWSRMRAPTPHGFALKTYAAQDFSSSHVFCFCASDENALRQWSCRLRLAKYGINLLRDYEIAQERVGRQLLNKEPHTRKRLAELHHLTRQTSMDCTGSAPLQTPLSRCQAPEMLPTRTMTPPPPHPLMQQRAVSLTPQSSTTIRRLAGSPLHNGCTKHHSVGTPAQNFYIR